MKVPVKPEY